MPKITDLTTTNKIYNGDIVDMLTIDNGEMFAIVRQSNGVFLKCPIDALSEYLPIKNKRLQELENSLNSTDVGYINGRLKIHDDEIIDLQKELNRLQAKIKSLKAWEGNVKILQDALSDARDFYDGHDNGNAATAYKELKNAIERFLGK